MMFDDRNRPPMFDDQMWAPTTVGIATNGIAPRRPCGCPQGTSVTCPMHPPGPGVFDVMQVTGWRPTDPQPSTVELSDATVERLSLIHI